MLKRYCETRHLAPLVRPLKGGRKMWRKLGEQDGGRAVREEGL